MTIKAVLFDMDGVLIDAKDWHYEALNKALRIFGFEITRFEHLEYYDGLPTSVKLKMLTKEKGLPQGLHNFINDLKQQYTLDIAYNNCKSRFIHEFALSRLKNEGYKIAVCSNSIRKSIEMMLERADILKYMDLVVSNQDVTAPKPDPEMYLVPTKIFGLNPEECLVVEDNEKGIAAAKAAGCHVFIIEKVEEVTYQNIKGKIREIEQGISRLEVRQ